MADYDLPLAELSRVAVRSDVPADEGYLPAGSFGTIVHVYKGGRAYEVEFERPFHCVLTLDGGVIDRVSGIS